MARHELGEGEMMKTLGLLVVLCGIACSMLCGCRKGNDLDNMSRADQEKTLTGDPVKRQQVGEEMKRKYLGSGGPQASTSAPTRP